MLLASSLVRVAPQIHSMRPGTIVPGQYATMSGIVNFQPATSALTMGAQGKKTFRWTRHTVPKVSSDQSSAKQFATCHSEGRQGNKQQAHLLCLQDEIAVNLEHT